METTPISSKSVYRDSGASSFRRETTIRSMVGLRWSQSWLEVDGKLHSSKTRLFFMLERHEAASLGDRGRLDDSNREQRAFRVACSLI